MESPELKKKGDFMKALNLLSLVLVSSFGLSANAKAMPQNFVALSKTLTKVSIYSNCEASAPVFCQDTEDVRLTEGYKKWAVDLKLRLTSLATEKGKLQDQVTQLESAAAIENDEFKRAKILDNIIAVGKDIYKVQEGLDYPGIPTGVMYEISDAPLNRTLDGNSSIYHSRGHYGTTKNLFRVLPLGGLKILVELFDRNNSSIVTEQMVTTCKFVIEKDTILDLAIPGTGETKLRCDLPNNRGFLRYDIAE